MIPGSANPLLLTSADSGYAIERSLRFNDADQSNLSRTPSAAGNRKTFTWNAWTKRSEIGGTQRLMFVGPGSNYFSISFNNDQIQVEEAGGSNSFYVYTNAVFRDPSSWYHVVIAVDTTQATQTNRVKVYVNGTEQPLTAGNNWPPQNADLQINNTVDHRIGRNDADCFNGFLADVHFIDGQALAATDFGELDDNGVWQPKEFTGQYNVSLSGGSSSAPTSTSDVAPSGSYGNGIASAALLFGASELTNGQNHIRQDNGGIEWSPAIALTGSDVAGAKCLYFNSASSSYAIEFKINGSWVTAQANAQNSIGTSSALITLATTGDWTGVRVTGGGNTHVTTVAGIFVNGTRLQSAYSIPAVNGFHLDFADNSSNAALGYDAAGSNNWTVNNLIAAPVGLATANQGMDVVTYTGTGSTQSISSLAFQPDFVWIKARNAGYNHVLFDSVRGTGGAKVLFSNNTSAEGGSSGQEGTVYGHVSAFNSNGFTVAAGTGTPLWVSNSGTNYIAWCWKAGGAASSNTDGTITSQVSASTDYGFSIAKYTGTGSAASIGTGLSSAPKMIITKNISAAASWAVYHSALGNGSLLELEKSDGAKNSASAWNSTNPTSSVFSVGNYADTNNQNEAYIAYCWSEVAGFSKFGSYSGGTNPKTITTGFKPRFLIFKRTDSANHWILIDSARGGTQKLAANLGVAENDNASIGDASQNIVEFLADGFKLTTTNAATNVSGGTYIYAAFASKPSGEGIDSLRDSPSNAATPTDTGAGGEVVGNYATLNPLYTGATLSDGNLKATKGSLATWEVAVSTIGMKQGKWYAEITIGTGNHQIGIVKLDDAVFASNTPLVDFPWGWGFINDSSTLRLRSYLIGGGSSTTDAAFGASGSNYVDGDILGLAYDADTQAFSIYKNGTLVGDTTSTWVVPPPAGTYAFAISLNTGNVSWNFGQRAFAYTAPSGYKALCTANLPEPTIADGSLYFDTFLYTGDGASSRDITLPLAADLLWIKKRSAVNSHQLADTVRGNNSVLLSNSTNQEQNPQTQFTGGGISSISGTTATLSSGTSNNDNVNANSSTLVGWAWDAGSSNTTIAAGSLNSSAYNQTDWSGNTTATNIATNVGNDLASVFDGNLANGTRAANNGGTGTLQWSSGTIQGNVRVYTGLAGTQGLTYYNGSTSNTIASVNNGWNDLGNIDLTRLDFVYSGGNITFINAIELDGKLLINTSVTPTNVPSIASTVRANPTAGFSIVTYSAASNPTIGHGLNAVPEFVIVKCTNVGSHWTIFHKDLGVNKELRFTTAAASTVSGIWGTDSMWTSSTFGVYQTINQLDNNYGNMVAYCFNSVEGYSSVGSYTGNGSTDGVFVHTGFKVAFLLLKCTNTTELWMLHDSARDTDNVVSKLLQPHTSDAEIDSVTNYGVDFLSNGFKFRSSSSRNNGSGNTYIYYAVAENSFQANGGLAR